MMKSINKLNDEFETILFLTNNIDSIENYKSLHFNKQFVEFSINLYKTISDDMDDKYKKYKAEFDCLMKKGESILELENTSEFTCLNGLKENSRFILFKCLNDSISYANVYFDNLTKLLYQSCELVSEASLSKNEWKASKYFTNISKYLENQKLKDLVDKYCNDDLFTLIRGFCNQYKHDKIIEISTAEYGGCIVSKFFTKEYYGNTKLEYLDSKNVIDVLLEIKNFMEKVHGDVMGVIPNEIISRNDRFLLNKHTIYKNRTINYIESNELSGLTDVCITFGHLIIANGNTPSYSYYKIANPVILVMNGNQPYGYLKEVDNTYDVCKKYKYIPVIDTFFDQNYTIGYRF